MKKQSFRTKHVGNDWRFIRDSEFPKSPRSKPKELDFIEEKFQSLKIDSSKAYIPTERRRSDLWILKNQPLNTTKSEKNIKKTDSTNYRSPWYIHPKHWQNLASIPQIDNNYIKDRAKNLYHFLHKSEPNLNSLKRKKPFCNNLDAQYSDTQNKLANLPVVHNYIK